MDRGNAWKHSEVSRVCWVGGMMAKRTNCNPVRRSELMAVLANPMYRGGKLMYPVGDGVGMMHLHDMLLAGMDITFRPSQITCIREPWNRASGVCQCGKVCPPRTDRHNKSRRFPIPQRYCSAECRIKYKPGTIPQLPRNIPAIPAQWKQHGKRGL